MMSLPIVPSVVGRAVAVSSFIFFMAAASSWYGLNPKVRMTRPGRKLNEPRFDVVRPHIEIALHALVVWAGFLFVLLVAVPLAADLVQLERGEKLAKFTGRIIRRTSGFGGLLLGERSVQFVRGGESYYLFYCWRASLHAGQTYEFTVLPRSRMILDFHAPGT